MEGHTSQNVKHSAVSTYSLHHLLQQEDEQRASAGSPACFLLRTEVVPAGALAGWPRRGWNRHRPVMDWRELETPRLLTSVISQTKQRSQCSESNHAATSWTLLNHWHFDTLLTSLSLLLRRSRFCRIPVRPVSVSHVDEPHHCSWRRSEMVKIAFVQVESKKWNIENSLNTLKMFILMSFKMYSCRSIKSIKISCFIDCVYIHLRTRLL